MENLRKSREIIQYADDNIDTLDIPQSKIDSWKRSSYLVKLDHAFAQESEDENEHGLSTLAMRGLLHLAAMFSYLFVDEPRLIAELKQMSEKSSGKKR